MSPAGATGSAASSGVAGGLADGTDDVVEVVDDEQLDGAVGQVEPQAGAHAAGEGVAVGRLAADAGDAAEGGLPAGAAGKGVEPIGLTDQALLGQVEPPPDGAASGLSPVGGTIPDNGLGLAQVGTAHPNPHDLHPVDIVVIARYVGHTVAVRRRPAGSIEWLVSLPRRAPERSRGLPSGQNLSQETGWARRQASGRPAGGQMIQVLGIDIGGTGIKCAPVDVAGGKLLAERRKLPTPHPAKPDAVAEVVQELVKAFEWTGSIGITFPGVVTDG